MSVKALLRTDHMGGVIGSRGSNPGYDRKSSVDGVAQIGPDRVCWF